MSLSTEWTNERINSTNKNTYLKVNKQTGNNKQAVFQEAWPAQHRKKTEHMQSSRKEQAQSLFQSFTGEHYKRLNEPTHEQIAQSMKV